MPGGRRKWWRPSAGPLRGVAADGKIPVMLGGEHSISFGAVQAMQEAFPEITVLQLDAHADLRDAYQGTPFSHAAVARRISGICPLVQAGIRSMSAEEAEFLPTSPVKSYSADFILENRSWCETICNDLNGDLYLTVDLDVPRSGRHAVDGDAGTGRDRLEGSDPADPRGVGPLPDTGVRCRGACPHPGDGRPRFSGVQTDLPDHGLFVGGATDRSGNEISACRGEK